MHTPEKWFVNLGSPLTGGVAAALTLFMIGCSVDQPASEATPRDPEKTQAAAPSSSPYDLRGLTIDPGPTEPTRYATPGPDDLVHFSRATPTTNPPEKPRMIAEWEPVQGAVVRYPLGISVDAVKQIASELPVYILCSSSQQSAASSAFKSGGVNMNNIKFVSCATDSYWTRDYSAWFVEAGPANDRKIELVDVIYRADGQRPNDDKVPGVLAGYFSMSSYRQLNYVCQGGNITGDGGYAGVSTDRILDENQSKSLSQLQAMAKSMLGLNSYYSVTDPAYPADYIKHIDCWAKFIPGNKVLVKRVPAGSSDYTKFEQAAKDWTTKTDANGQKYQVIRIDCPVDGPYVNHVILNDRVLVPAKGIAADNVAIQQIQAAYGSSYRVIGVKAASSAPWLGTDSIHCRVNSIPVLTASTPTTEPISFTSQPNSVTVSEGSSASFSVSVKGGKSPYTYQWFKNNAAISKAIAASYSFNATSADNGANFHAVVKDSAGDSVTSNAATLTVESTTEALSVDGPTPVSVQEGQEAYFEVHPSGGTAPYRFQWYKNNSLISGAASAFYSFTAQQSDSGSLFHVVVKDTKSQSVTSEPAPLTVQDNTEGGNLALNKQTSASSTFKQLASASAVDGNDGTYWASDAISKAGAEQWLAVDLGSSKQVSAIKVVFSPKNFPKSWSLEYQNGSTWVSAYSTTSGKGGLNEASFSAVSARNFRIRCSVNNSYYYSVYEFQILN